MYVREKIHAAYRLFLVKKIIHKIWQLWDFFCLFFELLLIRKKCISKLLNFRKIFQKKKFSGNVRAWKNPEVMEFIMYIYTHRLSFSVFRKGSKEGKDFSWLPWWLLIYILYILYFSRLALAKLEICIIGVS